MRFKTKLALWAPVLLSSSLMSSCAVLHQTQIGQIDNRPGYVLVPFEVMVSETGVSTEEIEAIGRGMESKGGDAVADAAAIVSLFQMGPRTGKLVYNEHYARNVIHLIHEKCPSGEITGLQSIREMRSYPVISGEIVKVSGFCRKTKKELKRGV